MINVKEEPEKEVVDAISEPEKTICEEISVAKSSECENEEKMDAESIQERRISQNSEQNNEQRDSTPMQTDNEEVSYMIAFLVFEATNIFVLLSFFLTNWKAPFSPLQQKALRID